MTVTVYLLVVMLASKPGAPQIRQGDDGPVIYRALADCLRDGVEAVPGIRAAFGKDAVSFGCKAITEAQLEVARERKRVLDTDLSDPDPRNYTPPRTKLPAPSTEKPVPSLQASWAGPGPRYRPPRGT